MGPTPCHRKVEKLKLKMILGKTSPLFSCLLSAIGMVHYHLADVCFKLCSTIERKWIEKNYCWFELDSDSCTGRTPSTPPSPWVWFSAAGHNFGQTFLFYDLVLAGGNSNIFYFHPYLGKWSNLTNIFRWVETTNQSTFFFQYQKFQKLKHHWICPNHRRQVWQTKDLNEL